VTRCHLKTVPRQVGSQHFGQFNVVIDQQNCRHFLSININSLSNHSQSSIQAAPYLQTFTLQRAPEIKRHSANNCSTNGFLTKLYLD